MGVYIYLIISKSVTKEEWEKVYEESLQLIKHFPLVESQKVKIHDIDTICLVKTEERMTSRSWFKEKCLGWSTNGDGDVLRTAETYYLPRELDEVKEDEKDATDAMFDAYHSQHQYNWKGKVHSLWGNKTQGEPYHIYLLAVAALIEARLGTKAFTDGDITRGQFRRAVEIANRYLDKPIDMPDRCCMDRLAKRTSKLPMPAKEQIKVFMEFYLGNLSAEFGDYMRQTFPEEAIEEFWKDKFDETRIGTGSFDNVFSEYLLLGFDFAKLPDYVHFEGKEGELKYEDFVKRVMDAKLHLKDKNCADPLNINQEEERPYSVATLFAQFVFGGARNKKVDRFIPIEEIRSALTSSIGDKCDVNGLIDAYLEEEAKQIKINLSGKNVSEEDIDKAVRQDAAEAFYQVMNIKKDEIKEEQEKYDITDYKYLKFYEPGCTMYPAMANSIAKCRIFLDSLLAEDEFRKLMEKDAKARCEWIVTNNKYILIRDSDWDKVFTNIENNKESFGRYYPFFRTRMDDERKVDMCTALMMNDELYEYSKLLAEGVTEE